MTQSPNAIYQPHYSSLDDPALDHETTVEEDKGPVTLDHIRRICIEYHVHARIERDGKLVGEMSKAGIFTPATT